MSAPLHERIRAEIEQGIRSGALMPGARLPTEQEITRRYGCARMTASRALSALAAAGLIERRKGAGSFVARPRVHAMVLDVPDLAGAIAARGQAYRFRLIERAARASVPEDAIAARTVLDIAGLHHADGVPLAAERRLVNLDAVPEMAEAVLAEQEPPGSWLLRHVPWTEAETRIAAVAADAGTADLLAVEPGAALLLVERRTWRGQAQITLVRQHFVGAAYDLIARFGPRGEAPERSPTD